MAMRFGVSKNVKSLSKMSWFLSYKRTKLLCSSRHLIQFWKVASMRSHINMMDDVQKSGHSFQNHLIPKCKIQEFSLSDGDLIINLEVPKFQNSTKNMLVFWVKKGSNRFVGLGKWSTIVAFNVQRFAKKRFNHDESAKQNLKQKH